MQIGYLTMAWSLGFLLLHKTEKSDELYRFVLKLSSAIQRDDTMTIPGQRQPSYWLIVAIFDKKGITSSFSKEV
jgi:hypothetical protein